MYQFLPLVPLISIIMKLVSNVSRKVTDVRLMKFTQLILILAFLSKACVLIHNFIQQLCISVFKGHRFVISIKFMISQPILVS